MGIDYGDIAVPDSTISLQFTFLWVDEDPGKVKTTTFKSGHLLRGGAEFRCE